MYRCALRAVAFTSMLSTQSYAQMNEYWTIPDTLGHAIENAKQLYPENESPTHPEVITLDQEPVELHGLYATLDTRHAPMKIVTFPRPPALQQDIPTSFAPGSLEDQIVGFIHKHEAPEKGYDAVWNKNKHPLPRAPTQMTVCEVRDWQLQARQVQESTAIGAYQIVGGTYRETLQALGLGCEVLFDQSTQDMFGLALLYKRGWPLFLNGSLSLEDFAYELAGEWAAFPAPYGPHRGFSRYRNMAGNKHQVELPVFIEFLRSLKDTARSDGAAALALNELQETPAGAKAGVIVVQIDDDHVVSDGLQELD